MSSGKGLCDSITFINTLIALTLVEAGFVVLIAVGLSITFAVLIITIGWALPVIFTAVGILVFNIFCLIGLCMRRSELRRRAREEGMNGGVVVAQMVSAAPIRVAEAMPEDKV